MQHFLFNMLGFNRFFWPYRILNFLTNDRSRGSRLNNSLLTSLYQSACVFSGRNKAGYILSKPQAIVKF